MIWIDQALRDPNVEIWFSFHMNQDAPVDGELFYPELLPLRINVIKTLESAGLRLFSDFMTVEIDHARHGFLIDEVDGNVKAKAIKQIVRRMFRKWKYHEISDFTTSYSRVLVYRDRLGWDLGYCDE